MNVDATVQGGFGKAGIGGVLRYHNGLCLMCFSKSIGVADPPGAELMAILEACRLFQSSRWYCQDKLLIESDCKLVVSWIANQRVIPSHLENLVANCKAYCESCSWKVGFVYREINVDAHALAQEGIERNPAFFGLRRTFRLTRSDENCLMLARYQIIQYVVK
ncbi:hypothetical protein F3Y22_tig00116971pilonHSYRG00766 [Hibiscus syriacus]|uniref:RNase H type-1 domain-containing protein n=1 Tax=Hibiscus syriacus TaxID=106335 RepID=A0A6A2WHN1_HIBSY|nr:hypothetical protein F3Y22_tig00116971pilonHSYRG00766 [Hibiscus syriacus]